MRTSGAAQETLLSALWGAKWEGNPKRIHIDDSLCCTVETNTTLQSNYEAIKCGEMKVAQSCPTLCDLMDYTVHGILQAKILEWVAFPFSRRSSQPMGLTEVSRIAGRFFTS